MTKIIMKFSPEELIRIYSGKQKYIARTKLPRHDVNLIVPFKCYCKSNKVFIVKEIKGNKKDVWHKVKGKIGMNIITYSKFTYHKPEIKLYEIEKIIEKDVDYEPTRDFNGSFMYI